MGRAAVMLVGYVINVAVRVVVICLAGLMLNINSLNVIWNPANLRDSYETNNTKTATNYRR